MLKETPSIAAHLGRRNILQLALESLNMSQNRRQILARLVLARHAAIADGQRSRRRRADSWRRGGLVKIVEERNATSLDNGLDLVLHVGKVGDKRALLLAAGNRKGCLGTAVAQNELTA